MEARRQYPKIKFIVGDAGDMEFDPASFDLVTESTMFVQITDDGLAQSIGNEMLGLLKPGGYLLLVDWRMPKPYDNSYRALTRERLNGLFDVGKSSEVITIKKGALAPPVGRFLSKFLPPLYFQ